MKILTKEEQDAHYSATVRGGAIGGLVGVGLGSAAVLLANRRFPGFRQLTVPFRAFLAVSTGTFSAIIAADHASRRYELYHNEQRMKLLEHVSEAQKYEKTKPFLERARDWAGENRYKIVFGSWVASMVLALGLVRGNRFLTAQQKIVQARVYAQGLTIGVLLASFAIETSDATRKRGRWETVKVLDPTDPLHQRLIEKRIHHEKYEGEDQWMEIIAAEEEKMKERAKMHEEERKVIHDAQEKAHHRH